MVDCCQFHSEFLQKLFLLYVSIDEKIQDEGSRLVLAQYLDFFHDDMLSQLPYPDFYSSLGHPGALEVALEMFMEDCSGLVMNVESTSNNLFHDFSYTTISQVKAEIRKLVKNLDNSIASAQRSSSHFVKSKKLPFE